MPSEKTVYFPFHYEDDFLKVFENLNYDPYHQYHNNITHNHLDLNNQVNHHYD